MTPLAYRIVNELTLPLKDRTFADNAGILGRMAGVHCFDVTDASPLIDELSSDLLNQEALPVDETSFLPAPRTWIEVTKRTEDGRFRMGWLLEDHPADRGAVTVSVVFKHDDGLQFGSADNGLLRLASCEQPAFKAVAGAPTWSLILGALALINSPRIIGRRQHMPHRGLERRLVARRCAIGKFPLHAWTEIKLHVTPPHDASGEKSTEAHLTGERALHFCRAHLRIRLGKLEVVRGHWRGDASLGIRRSRYVLKADRSARS